jgi:Zn-dependent M28 family amino/carboxypeptidase
MRFVILACVAVCFSPVAAAPAATISDLTATVSMSNLQGHVTALSGDRASVAGRNAARSYIAGQLQGFGYTTTIDAAGNVIAERTGVTTPGKIQVVGAHFDAVAGAPGADDNATGVAAVLEMARIFSNKTFDSTVRFVAFDQEEIGLVGSLAYTQAVANAGENIDLATIFDMIGYTSPTQAPVATGNAGALGSFAVSENRLVGDFVGLLVLNKAQILSDYVNAAALYAPALPVVSGLFTTSNVANPNTHAIFSDLYRSDHVGFWLHGYDAILLGDTANYRNPNYHKPGDTVATLNFPFMTQVVQSSLGFVAERAGLVSVPEPSSGLLLTAGLAGVVTMSWRRARGRRTDA